MLGNCILQVVGCVRYINVCVCRFAAGQMKKGMEGDGAGD